MRRMRSSHIFLVLLAAVLAVPLSAALAEDFHPQGENLLDNPGFEGDYEAFDPLGDIKVATSWEPWYVEGDEESQAEGYDRAPSYYWASEDTDPGGTKEGTFSQYWKHTYGTGAGGVLQFVEVPANSRLRFAAWIRTFTCHADNIEDDCVQDDDGWMGVQLGVDPKGGEDFYDASVVDMPAVGSTANQWQEVSMEVDACEGTTVTVYIMSHPDFPRQQNKTWVDNASLIRVGDADCSGTGTSGGGAAAAAPASGEVPFVTPQPPQSDGSIVHTVEAGQTLSSIAVAYYNQGHTDITVPKIKELNNLSSDIIYVGQKLTILPPGSAAGAPAAAEPAAEEETTEETEEEEEPTPTPEPTEVAETTGQVCMSLFNDANSNTLRDPDELLLAGGTLTLSNNTGMMENYTTDGATEPHCYSDLTPGEYVASATAPAGYEMTTVSSWSIQVDSGANLDLTFGSFGTGEVAAGDTGGDTEDGGGVGGNLGRILIGLSGLLVLAVAGGLGAYFLVFRRT